MATIKVKIDGQDLEVEAGTTILDAAKKMCINIPTLCKHPDVKATGACGICVVKMVGSPKMLRACTTPITKFEDGKEFITHDDDLFQIRRTVLELILSDHPNECFTCGRNNNCELQKLAADFGIREIPFTQVGYDHSEDDSSLVSMKLEPHKCVKCGRCVQICQTVQNVYALCVLHRGYKTKIAGAGIDLELADSPCIKCGQCSAHCPTGAIVERDDTERVWQLLNSGKHTTVQIAPAVRVAVGEAFGMAPGTLTTGKIYAALRRLGFNAVFDTNFSADLTIMEEGSEFIARLTKVEGKGALPLITSCCPAWVDYMEKFACDVMEHFSTAKSPQQMLGAVCKTYYAQQKKIAAKEIINVAIMPCTAKKWEIGRDVNMNSSGTSDVDAVLTTREFCRMIKQAGIDFNELPEETADRILGEYTGAGTIFGNTGGVMEAAVRTVYKLVTGKELDALLELTPVRGLAGVKEAKLDVAGTEVRVAVASGVANVEYLLNKIRDWKKNGALPAELPWHFIEVMACPGGCIAGGGQPYGVQEKMRQLRTEGLYADDRHCQFRRSHENPEVQALYKNFLGAPLSEKAHHLLHTHYTCRPKYKK